MKRLILALALSFALAAGTVMVLTVQPRLAVAGSCIGPGC
jgi:hypothetical protein